jgi:hypothetical protein
MLSAVSVVTDNSHHQSSSAFCCPSLHNRKVRGSSALFPAAAAGQHGRTPLRVSADHITLRHSEIRAPSIFPQQELAR